MSDWNERDKAFEKMRKQMYGGQPVPIDTITIFTHGWNAALESLKRPSVSGDDNTAELRERRYPADRGKVKP